MGNCFASKEFHSPDEVVANQRGAAHAANRPQQRMLIFHRPGKPLSTIETSYASEVPENHDHDEHRF